MIRLAHVFSSDLGIEASLPYILPLLARGWQVTAISPDGPCVASAVRLGVRHLPLSIRRSLDLSGDTRGSLQLFGYFRKAQFDIVHTHNIKVGLIARVLATLARVPVLVHTMHGLAYSMETPVIPRFLHGTLERIASVRVNAILAQSEEDRATVLATGVAPPRTVRSIGNGIDLEVFDSKRFGPDERASARESLSIDAADVLFVSAGRLVREKGYVELFEAAARARLRNPQIRLVVAGRRDLDKADSIDSETIERARAGGVLVLGERRDMAPLYAAADAVVLGSWREGLPRVLMEGAAMGKALVATDIRGCREIVRPPANGILVPARDVASMADALITMAADPERREEWGRANAIEARERYDLREVVRRVHDIYDDLLLRREHHS